MPIPPRLFIDACVLVAAANSPSGGSARLLQIAGEGKIRLAATRLVMHEAKTNIIDLLGRPVWPWFCQIIGPLRLSLADPPTSKEKGVIGIMRTFLGTPDLIGESSLFPLSCCF